MQPNTSLPRVCPTSDVAGALCTNLISRILTYRLAEVNRPVPGVSRFFACARACQRGRALFSLFWRGSCASNRRAESVLPRLRHAGPAADAGSSRRTRRLRAVPALSSLRIVDVEGRDKAEAARRRTARPAGLGRARVHRRGAASTHPPSRDALYTCQNRLHPCFTGTKS